METAPLRQHRLFKDVIENQQDIDIIINSCNFTCQKYKRTILKYCHITKPASV
jgi:hypothetical protein